MIALLDDTGEAAVGPISDTDVGSDAVSESAANGTTVGVTALATDGDGTDTVSYGLDDSAGGRFGIDAGSGIVTVADASLARLRNVHQPLDHGAGELDGRLVQHPDLRDRSARRPPARRRPGRSVTPMSVPTRYRRARRTARTSASWRWRRMPMARTPLVTAGRQRRRAVSGSIRARAWSVSPTAVCSTTRRRPATRSRSGRLRPIRRSALRRS